MKSCSPEILLCVAGGLSNSVAEVEIIVQVDAHFFEHDLHHALGILDLFRVLHASVHHLTEHTEESYVLLCKNILKTVLGLFKLTLT